MDEDEFSAAEIMADGLELLIDTWEKNGGIAVMHSEGLTLAFGRTEVVMGVLNRTAKVIDMRRIPVPGVHTN